MKKAALTFGLFSLVMVATSFATPQNNDIYKGDINTTLETDGTGATGGPTKKGDSNRMTFDTTNDSSLGTINQSVGGNKKLD